MSATRREKRPLISQLRKNEQVETEMRKEMKEIVLLAI
jgi:hypothetical protein